MAALPHQLFFNVGTFSKLIVCSGCHVGTFTIPSGTFFNTSGYHMTPWTPSVLQMFPHSIEKVPTWQPLHTISFEKVLTLNKNVEKCKVGSRLIHFRVIWMKIENIGKYGVMWELFRYYVRTFSILMVPWCHVVTFAKWGGNIYKTYGA